MKAGLRLSPWASQALGDDDRAGLLARAKSLGAYVTAGGSNGRWTVHVFSENNAIRESVYHEPGPLAVLIGSMLDAFRRQRDIVDEQLADLGVAWTVEELVQVAAQSGLAVRRA